MDAFEHLWDKVGHPMAGFIVPHMTSTERPLDVHVGVKTGASIFSYPCALPPPPPPQEDMHFLLLYKIRVGTQALHRV